MEYWDFYKKDLKLISELMVKVLLKKPDNSELSVRQIFKETLNAEVVNGIDKDGNEVSGLRIADIKLDSGKYLHDFVKWDYENGVWSGELRQFFTLERFFLQKAVKAGYVVDASRVCGVKMGLSFNLSIIFRNKTNLLASFCDIDETEILNSQGERYYVRSRIETRHYSQVDFYSGKLSEYDQRIKLNLWRIPARCSTGMMINENGRVSCDVMQGRCLFESSRWTYYYDTDDNLNDEVEEPDPSWHEWTVKDELRVNHSGFSQANGHGDPILAPRNAWFKITNLGKKDLLVFVVNAEETEICRSFQTPAVK